MYLQLHAVKSEKIQKKDTKGDSKRIEFLPDRTVIIT